MPEPVTRSLLPANWAVPDVFRRRLGERFGADDWRTAESRLILGEAFLASGQTSRASTLVREADTVLQKTRKTRPQLARESADVMARLR